MLVFLTFIAFGIVMFQFSAPLQMGVLASYTQNLCVNHMPDSRYFDFYAAIICDQKIVDQNLRADFARTALLHLVVASGTHLILIERVVAFLAQRHKKLKWTLVPLLLSFAFATGLSAPFVRILCAWGFRALQKRFRLGWPPLQILFLSGFATMFINFGLHPNGTGLFSLALSWIAATAAFLIFSSRAREPGLLNTIQLQVVFYLMMIPVLLPLSVPHPISILWNALLAPILSVCLFPLALFGAAFGGPVLNLTDFCFATFNWLLHLIAKFTPSGFEKTKFPIIWPWLYLFSLSIFAIYLDRRDRVRALEAGGLEP